MSYPYHSGYDSHRSYPSTPIQNSYGQRRSSSSTSQPQAQAFPLQSFQSPIGSLDLSNPYNFNQSNDWSQNTVGLADTPNVNIGSSNFNAAELNPFIRPEGEDSWNPTGRTQGRAFNNNVPLFIPPSAFNIPKANTVAGGVVSSSHRQNKRPLIPPRASFAASNTDSGYYSAQTLDSIPSSAQKEFNSLDVTAVNPYQPSTDAPPSALSVKTEPVAAGKKNGRRRPKSSVDDCRYCGKELKNNSEAK